MQARSIKGGSADEFRADLQKNMENGFRPTLAFVFLSISQDRAAICEMLHAAGVDFLGATSCGEFINGYQGMGSTVALLLDLPRDSFSIIFEEVADDGLKTAASRMAGRAMDTFSQPALILCSTGVSAKMEFFPGPLLVSYLVDMLGPQVSIYGGMAGDDGQLTGSFLFTYGRSGDRSIAAVVLNEERVDLHGLAISGWKPLGTVKTVTRSQDEWIYSIDGQPALDMYLRYLGQEPSVEQEDGKILGELGLYYPLLSFDAGDPVIRTPLRVDREKKAIQLDFAIPEGKQVQFTVPPDFDIVENVLHKAKELKNGSAADAEALLIFSCAGRLNALGPMATTENEGLFELWKAPMAGFFTYGEYGHSSHAVQQFHSTTCCWVALEEKAQGAKT